MRDSLLVVDFCLIKLLNFMFQNHKQGHMSSFITGKVLGAFMKNFCIVLRTLSQIQWCNFCIENLNNLEFVFVIPIILFIITSKQKVLPWHLLFPGKYLETQENHPYSRVQILYFMK